MPTKYKQSIFKPKHPEKYVGKGSIQMRSSWETHFAYFLDNNPNILEWASEAIRILYKHPFKGKNTFYVPDFLIRYKDRTGTIVTELIEIKPLNQSVLKEGMNEKQRATIAINHAKWSSATSYCKKAGIKFRVVTESDLFRK